jgi:hypothetical protein
VIETSIYIIWMVILGLGGYYLGRHPLNPPIIEGAGASSVMSGSQDALVECPPEEGVVDASAVPLLRTEAPRTPESMEKLCSKFLSNASLAVPLKGVSKFAQLKHEWRCSKAEYGQGQPKSIPVPAAEALKKTKWKSILSIEPRAFFDKYLSQYPGDTRIEHPVVLFSHKPLNSAEEVPEVCRVLDIAIVPNTPGVCVAVTETYHDVASYHMLHAGKQDDGSFSLTANSLKGRAIPDEFAYAGARALIVDYYKYHLKVMNAMEYLPRTRHAVLVGSFIDSFEDLKLFQNSILSALRVGTPETVFFLVTSTAAVAEAMQKTKVTVVFIPELAKVGQGVSANVRRHFIQAWLAFASADTKASVLWEAPGTVWFTTPDRLLSLGPSPIETSWAYKGREDSRSAPFFCSFDFFYQTSSERPLHLFHEILLHADLVLAWNSLDAVASYRLAENNARYGTTTYIWPPFVVLHTAVINNDASELRAAVGDGAGPERPQVVVVAHEGMPKGDAERMLRESGLYFL